MSADERLWAPVVQPHILLNPASMLLLLLLLRCTSGSVLSKRVPEAFPPADRCSDCRWGRGRSCRRDPRNNPGGSGFRDWREKRRRASPFTRERGAAKPFVASVDVAKMDVPMYICPTAADRPTSS